MNQRSVAAVALEAAQALLADIEAAAHETHAERFARYRARLWDACDSSMRRSGRWLSVGHGGSGTAPPASCSPRNARSAAENAPA